MLFRGFAGYIKVRPHTLPSAMRRLFTAILVALAATAATATAQDPSVKLAVPAPVQDIEVKLLDEGLYEVLGATQDLAAPDTAPGRITEHDGLRLIQATNTFVARKKLVFGFRFALRAQLFGEVSSFEMATIHPPMRGVDGQVHTSQLAPMTVAFENGVAYQELVYALSEDFEVLPGEWTLEVRYKSHLLISRKFTLLAQ